jgi:RNA polymerase sigma-70 factor, ECF subfamily
VTDREAHWCTLMRAANRGDTSAYHQLLRELAPVLRGVVAKGFARYQLGQEDTEDVVQEALLALHLKRHTWDESQPLLPWLSAIARHKTIDSMRRRGKRAYLPIEDVSDILAADPQPQTAGSYDAERIIATLKGRQREIVQAISMEGASTRQVAQRLGMTEGAVRVALHRALQSLATTFRRNLP